MEKKFIQAMDLKPTSEPPPPTPSSRGPQTGTGQMKDPAFLAMYATPEELASFRAAVEARRAQAAIAGWRILPDGRRIRADNVLAGCPKCRRWLWATPANVPGPCPVCNWRRMKDGGMLRAATADEEKAWIRRETEAWQKFLAAKPERDREQREFIKRQIQDGKFK